MKIIENTTPIIFNDKVYCRFDVEYNEKKYIREETNFPELHTIVWKSFDEKENKMFGFIEYYIEVCGWTMNDGILNKENPVPEIERIFLETFSKELK
jgi:hypothetical protein